MDSIIIGISGGSGSGKTTVVRRIMQELTSAEVAFISQDSYYRDSSMIPLDRRQLINFDHPDSIEFDLLVRQLTEIKSGLAIEEPVYDYISSSRMQDTIPVQPHHVVVVEGILLFTDSRVRDLCTIKVYVDAEADDRLIRILRRDMRERGRSAADVLDRYDVVKSMHEQFIEPTKKYADLIIPHGGENLIAIDILVSMIRQKLMKNNQKV